jgi:hypothetical protein
MLDKINCKYRDVSDLKYKKELNKFALNDLKEIASANCLTTSGTRTELMHRISEKLCLREYTNDELSKAKSFQSSSSIIKKKKKNEKISKNDPNPNYISDSD